MSDNSSISGESSDLTDKFLDLGKYFKNAMKKTFGVILESLMQERRISIRQLAKELGVPPKTVQEWVGQNGRTPRHSESIKKLAEFFQCSIHYLLFGEEDPNNPLNAILEKTEIHTGLYEISIRKVKTKTP